MIYVETIALRPDSIVVTFSTREIAYIRAVGRLYSFAADDVEVPARISRQFGSLLWTLGQVLQDQAFDWRA